MKLFKTIVVNSMRGTQPWNFIFTLPKSENIKAQMRMMSPKHLGKIMLPNICETGRAILLIRGVENRDMTSGGRSVGIVHS